MNDDIWLTGFSFVFLTNAQQHVYWNRESAVEGEAWAVCQLQLWWLRHSGSAQSVGRLCFQSTHSSGVLNWKNLFGKLLNRYLKKIGDWQEMYILVIIKITFHTIVKRVFHLFTYEDFAFLLLFLF